MGVVITIGADDMKISKESVSCYECRLKKMWGKYAEFKALNLDEVDDCTMFYIKDWSELDSATQGALGSQLQMFDEEEKRWIPQ